jgi:CheY-like chemotaxis protein
MAVDFISTGVRPIFEEEEYLLFRKKRILLIEDDWDFSQVLSGLLCKHLDIEVEVVKNTFQALSRMTHEPYDVMVLYCNLNPFQALLEAEEFLAPVLEENVVETDKVPVIVLTEDDSESLQGLESHYFRIISAVQKEPRLTRTLQKIEEEINELLDL